MTREYFQGLWDSVPKIMSNLFNAKYACSSACLFLTLQKLATKPESVVDLKLVLVSGWFVQSALLRLLEKD